MLQWFKIKEAYGSQIIGAAAFKENELVAVVSFFEDKDMDRDGKVGIAERLNLFRMKGAGIAACFTGLKSDPALFMKDANAINQGWGSAFVGLGAGLVADGIYAAYFNRAVKGIAGVVASTFTTNPVKSFVIRKGMEKVVKDAYHSSL